MLCSQSTVQLLLSCCAAAAMLLSQLHMVVGQGLDVSDESLGFSATATAIEFDTFEDLLVLSTLGGRGRGGRGGSGNLGSSFREARDFQQLQTSVYYLGGSPSVYNSWNASQTPGKIKYVPNPQDQGSCNSCVGMAVAVAVQMAVARTTWERVAAYAISPRAWYYCTAGGRTCKTGWDTPAALRALEQNPEWMMPKQCFEKALSTSAELDLSDFRSVCKDAADRCKSDPGINAVQSFYTCSYRSLSSFWQIQQHIRNHGAVITRLVVPDDFNIQFNASVKNTRGIDLPPYRRNVTAKALFGHAALIVGYDNDNYTFTVLNSCEGGANKTSNSRKTGGVTADGMFKIQMGLAGVGTPDLTYGVVCEPAAGTASNPYGNRPWLERQRKPVIPAVNEKGFLKGCYIYNITKGDTVASVVDHFGLDMRTFVQKDNPELFKVDYNMTYKYSNTINLDEITGSLTVVDTSMKTSLRSKYKQPPYFVCYFYDAGGSYTRVVCDINNATACTPRGTVSCSLYYSDFTVDRLAVGQQVKVCNTAWLNDTKAFNQVAYPVSTGDASATGIPVQQEVALRRLLQAIVPNLTYAEAGADGIIQCSGGNESNPEMTYKRREISLRDFNLSLAIECSENTTGNVTGLYFRVKSSSDSEREGPKKHPNLSAAMVNSLLELKDLKWLEITVYSGQVYPQLALLSQLTRLSIDHYCMTRGLPANLLEGNKMESLSIKRGEDALGLTDSTIGKCGITGYIPAAWYRKGLNNTKLKTLNLANNALIGELPDTIIGGELAAGSLEEIILSDNQFTGRIPASWGDLKAIKVIDLSFNLLEGYFPVSWRALDNGTLQELYLYGNRGLEGCVPITTIDIEHFDNQLPICQPDKTNAVPSQNASISQYFIPLLTANADTGTVNMIKSMATQLQSDLGESVEPGSSIKVFLESHPEGLERGTCRVTVELIDGLEYITSIAVYAGENIAPTGLNLTYLPLLAEKLPYLIVFYCDACSLNPGNNLPDDLPAVAPRLQVLDLSYAEIQGQLPATYGNWSSLRILDLRQNKLTGGLPVEWGTGSMSNQVGLFLANNPGIEGTIPWSWRNFTTERVDLRNTSITGCYPNGMKGRFPDNVTECPVNVTGR